MADLQEKTYTDEDINVPLFPQYGSNLSPYSMDLNNIQFNPAVNQGGVEYIFPAEAGQKKKRTIMERICYGTGVPYLIGLGGGGAYGLYEGLKNPAGMTTKLRVNSVLNSMTRRGPFLGNTFGVCALMFNSLEGFTVWARNGEESPVNTVGAATVTGLIFKSTSGLRSAGIAGAVGAGLAGVFVGAKYLIEDSERSSSPMYA